MKTQTLFLITAITACIFSCKKNKDERIVDMKTLFSDTTWVGEFKYASRPIAEPFCIRFNATGTFTWYEVNGDYTGTYSVNNNAKTIKINFDGGSIVTATITNNSKLTNFQYGAAYPWVINNSELVTAAAVPELTGTNWEGNIAAAPIIPIIIRFFAPGNLNFSDNYPFFELGVPYQIKHATVRINFVGTRKMFGIINNGRITGVEFTPGPFRRWEATKQ